MLIDVENGTRLRLAGNYRRRLLPNGILIGGGDGWTFVPSLNGYVVTEDLAQQIVKSGWAHWEGSGLFDNEPLSEAVFGWPAETELRGLLETIPSGANCIDVGCGFGRLLRPLVAANRSVVGVDHSFPAVASLVRKGYHAICAPIEDFSYPGFTHGFAALNTLRYLETWFAWNRHFAQMRRSLNSGGHYLINLSLVENPEFVRRNEWTFTHEGATCCASWQVVDFDRLEKVLVERVTIAKNSDSTILHEEYQIQLWITPNALSGWLSVHGDEWRLIRSWDASWNLVAEEVALQNEGTYWFELENL